MLSRIFLKNFRNYAEAEFTFKNPITIFLGPNGVGKTNLLEAISLLEKSKGLRGNDLEDMQTEYTHRGWFLEVDYDNQTLSVHYQEKKKQVRHLDQPISHAKINEMFKIIWLGPQNDRVFSGSPDQRRKFFDTVWSIFEPEYKGIKAQYQHYILERTQLLYHNEDQRWLHIIEQKIYEQGILLIEKRQKTLDKLNAFLAQVQFLEKAHFQVQELPFSLPLIEESRKQDVKMGGCSVGPHRADYEGWYKQRRLRIASQGEQCLGQISIFLALILYLTCERSVIFLIDDVFSYLDITNQEKLIKMFQAIPRLQVFITTPKILGEFKDVDVKVL